MRTIVTLFSFFLALGGVSAQDISFSKETFTFARNTLPYRKAIIAGEGDKPSLVVYLHGGSSKGNDNETQMNEPGIDSISMWLVNNGRKAIMLVPQCPKDKSWLGTMLGTVKALLQSYVDSGQADADKIYVFGGSMGGTGTWNMLANYPDFFAAAMPVAGNPSGLDAQKVSQTPLYTVMGTADAIMKVSNVETFLSEANLYNALYGFDVEQGWTHEDVCKRSYTASRLEWVFSNIKGDVNGVLTDFGDPIQIVSTQWYTLSGQKLSVAPNERGIFLKKTLMSNGHTQTQKIWVGN